MKFEGFKKIESIRKLQKYKLPTPETIFIFDFKKQEKEIDDFLKGKEFITVRSDKKGRTDFCPCDLRCPRSRAKAFIGKIIGKGYAAILQRYIPIRKNRLLSGNILVLKNEILLELMGSGPLTLLNRKGKLEEQIRLKKDKFYEISHQGRRLIGKKNLINLAKLVRNVPPYTILEFTLVKEGPFFWQIKEDKTAKLLENNK